MSVVTKMMRIPLAVFVCAVVLTGVALASERGESTTDGRAIHADQEDTAPSRDVGAQPPSTAPAEQALGKDAKERQLRVPAKPEHETQPVSR